MNRKGFLLFPKTHLEKQKNWMDDVYERLRRRFAELDILLEVTHDFEDMISKIAKHGAEFVLFELFDQYNYFAIDAVKKFRALGEFDGVPLFIVSLEYDKINPDRWRELGVVNTFDHGFLTADYVIDALSRLPSRREEFSSAFISFGGPDEDFAYELDVFLRSRGVKTWFFPNDATPGQKLHREMSNGVAKFDRVILICSKASLSRPGVLNEIERVLEKEAEKGGLSILVPITRDDFVFSLWKPERSDLARQIRSRVILKADQIDGKQKLLRALRRFD